MHKLIKAYKVVILICKDFADSFGGYMENDELRDILAGVVYFQCMNNTEKSE